MAAFVIIALVVVVLVMAGLVRVFTGAERSPRHATAKSGRGNELRLPEGGPFPIRDTPDLGRDSRGMVPGGSLVSVIEYRDDMARVTGPGFEGWICIDEVERIAESVPHPPE